MSLLLPPSDEYAPYYARYVQEPECGDILVELSQQAALFPNYLLALPEGKHNYKYQPGKWTVKEVAGHVIETERIMACRALRISRNDPTPLPGFDQNNYVEQIDYGIRALADLAEEFRAVRSSNLYLFRSFTDKQLHYKGTASGYAVSVRALLYIISGHLKHHMRILDERYL